MTKYTARVLALAALLGGCASSAFAQAPRPPTGAYAYGVGVPGGAHDLRRARARLRQTCRRPGRAPCFIRSASCFPAQGNASTVEPQTYLYYMELSKRVSQPSQNMWTPWNEETEQTAVADHKRLWATGFLSDLSIDAQDYTFSNGVIGKLVTYNMEERERVKIVNYEGIKPIGDRAKVDEQLRARSIELRLDSFLDNGTIRRIETVLREMMAEKGFTNAAVTHTVTRGGRRPQAGERHLQRHRGAEDQDPERRVPRQRREERRHAAAQDEGQQGAEPVLGLDHPRRHLPGSEVRERRRSASRPTTATKGTSRRRSASPSSRCSQTARDGKTRWVQLRIPVTEGQRYRVGSFAIDGNTVVKSEALLPLFKVKVGDWYNEKDVRDGLVKAREIYGAGGYMEFTGFPDIKPARGRRRGGARRARGRARGNRARRPST